MTVKRDPVPPTDTVAAASCQRRHRSGVQEGRPQISRESDGKRWREEARVGQRERESKREVMMKEEAVHQRKEDVGRRKET